MSGADRVAERSAPIKKRLNRDGYTPIGSAGPEDVPQGAFQPPPPPYKLDPRADADNA